MGGLIGSFHLWCRSLNCSSLQFTWWGGSTYWPQFSRRNGKTTPSRTWIDWKFPPICLREESPRIRGICTNYRSLPCKVLVGQTMTHALHGEPFLRHRDLSRKPLGSLLEHAALGPPYSRFSLGQGMRSVVTPILMRALHILSHQCLVSYKLTSNSPLHSLFDNRNVNYSIFVKSPSLYNYMPRGIKTTDPGKCPSPPTRTPKFHSLSPAVRGALGNRSRRTLC